MAGISKIQIGSSEYEIADEKVRERVTALENNGGSGAVGKFATINDQPIIIGNNETKTNFTQEYSWNVSSDFLIDANGNTIESGTYNYVYTGSKYGFRIFTLSAKETGANALVKVKNKYGTVIAKAEGEVTLSGGSAITLTWATNENFSIEFSNIADGMLYEFQVQSLIRQ